MLSFIAIQLLPLFIVAQGMAAGFDPQTGIGACGRDAYELLGFKNGENPSQAQINERMRILRSKLGNIPEKKQSARNVIAFPGRGAPRELDLQEIVQDAYAQIRNPELREKYNQIVRNLPSIGELMERKPNQLIVASSLDDLEKMAKRYGIDERTLNKARQMGQSGDSVFLPFKEGITVLPREKYAAWRKSFENYHTGQTQNNGSTFSIIEKGGIPAAFHEESVEAIQRSLTLAERAQEWENSKFGKFATGFQNKIEPKLYANIALNPELKLTPIEARKILSNLAYGRNWEELNFIERNLVSKGSAILNSADVAKIPDPDKFIADIAALFEIKETPDPKLQKQRALAFQIDIDPESAEIRKNQILRHLLQDQINQKMILASDPERRMLFLLEDRLSGKSLATPAHSVLFSTHPELLGNIPQNIKIGFPDEISAIHFSVENGIKIDAMAPLNSSHFNNFTLVSARDGQAAMLTLDNKIFYPNSADQPQIFSEGIAMALVDDYNRANPGSNLEMKWAWRNYENGQLSAEINREQFNRAAHFIGWISEQSNSRGPEKSIRTRIAELETEIKRAHDLSKKQTEIRAASIANGGRPPLAAVPTAKVAASNACRNLISLIK